MALEWQVIPESEKPVTGTTWIYDETKQTWVLGQLMMIQDDAPGFWQPVPMVTVEDE